MSWSLIAAVLLGQVPASETLSPKDQPLFDAEVHRMEKLLETAGDKCTVRYALARTWASGGQYKKAVEALERAVDLRAGLDPSNDKVFEKLRGSKEYEAIVRRVRADTPPILRSKPAFVVRELNQFPEGIAYDSRRKRFFLGSTNSGKIIECNAAGVCREFARGFKEVLGLRVDPNDGSLWAASNGGDESALFHFEVPSGKLIRRFTIAGRHALNDVAVSPQGDVFVTESRGGIVYRIVHDGLEEFRRDLSGANGIAISGTKLYVSSFPDGIEVIDLKSGDARAIGHPANLCLATIDGLYFSNGNLIAIQNGAMVHRVARFELTKDGMGIRSSTILERRDLGFDVTTGAVVGKRFYFMANTQIDKVVDGKIVAGARWEPLEIFSVSVR